jgi:hypothetical protein
MGKKRHEQKAKPTNGPIDLAALGKWEAPMVIEWGGRRTEIILRTVGDIQEGQRLGALAAQAERRRLEERDHPIRHALIASLELQSAAELTELAIAGERDDLENKALRELPFPVTPQRDTGESDEEFGKRMAEFEKAVERTRSEREERVEKELAERRVWHEGRPREELMAAALERAVFGQAIAAFNRELYAYLIFKACRCADDPTNPAFATLDDARECRTELRDAIIAAYDEHDLAWRRDESLPTVSPLTVSSSSMT